jgi:hypothetical protein
MFIHTSIIIHSASGIENFFSKAFPATPSDLEISKE